MDNETMVHELKRAASLWDERHPTVCTFDIRYGDALREAADRIASLSEELARTKFECKQLQDRIDEMGWTLHPPQGAM